MYPYGPAVLRLGVGAVFVGHGAHKLFGAWGGGPSATAAFLDALGLSPAYPLAVFAGLLELAGGLLLIGGLLTFVASCALLAQTVAAVWIVRLPHGFFLNWSNAPGQGHGFEFHLVLIAGLLALMMTGPGAASVDELRARSAESQAAGRARIRAGHM